MPTKDQINADFISAMKNKTNDKQTLNSLRAAIKQVEVDTREDLDEDGVIKVLKSEAKKRKDSIEAYQAGNRDDLVANEQAELTIIEKYLPAQMTADQLKPIVEQVIADMNAGPADMGKVMGAVMAKIKETDGDADGKLVQQIVKDTLTP